MTGTPKFDVADFMASVRPWGLLFFIEDVGFSFTCPWEIPEDIQDKIDVFTYDINRFIHNNAHLASASGCMN